MVFLCADMGDYRTICDTDSVTVYIYHIPYISCHQSLNFSACELSMLKLYLNASLV